MRTKLILFFILCTAFFLRLHNLDKRGIFTDEKYSLLNANGIWVGGNNQPEITNNKYFTPKDFWKQKHIQDYFDAIANSDFGTHITYNAVLHPYMLIFGNSDFTIRFLSIAFNLLTIILIFSLVKNVFESNNAALFSAFFVAVEPLNIAQSHIARSYTLSFLLIILATWLFIKSLDNKIPVKKRNFFSFIYAIVIGLSLLNHYLNFLVPLCHGLVFVFLKQNLKTWFKLIGAAVFNVFLMLWWFSYGGGYSSLDYLKDKNAKHLILAQKNVFYSIQLSKPDIVAKKSISLFFDTNILTFGTYEVLNGVKNFGITIFFFALLLLIFYFFKIKRHKIALAVLACWLLGLIIFNSFATAIIVSNFCYFILYFSGKFLFETNKIEKNQSQKILIGISLLMVFLPILFVIYDAFKNGQTTSLNQRYIGISTPFAAILMGVGIVLVIRHWKPALLLLVVLIPTQYLNVKKEINLFFADQSGKYAWFSPARNLNPYFLAAEIIKNKYSKGDTVLIPSGFRDIYSQLFEKNAGVNYTDAQYLNLYLPKKAEIIERIDKRERDKFVLINKLGKKTVIFDLQGGKFRY